MDVQPIYCAEQIVVPPDLADVLKIFTKEVIRKQPSNLVEFSAQYFADLAEKASSLHSVSPPAKQQLRQAYLTLRETPKVPLADLSIACQSAGISSETVQRVVAAGRINTSAAVSILEVVLLLLTMSCDTFSATVQGIFEVFGSSNSKDSSKVPVQDFLTLLGYLATYDSDITSQLQQEVSKRLLGQAYTDYMGLFAIPALAERLSQ